MSTSPRPSTPSKSPTQPSSRSRLRSQNAHSEPESSVPYLSQGPDALLLPEGSLSEEAVELLHEFVHPHRHDKRRAGTEDTIVAESTELPDQRDRKSTRLNSSHSGESRMPSSA